MPGLGHRLEEPVLVERLQAPQVEHLARRLGGQCLRGARGHMHHRAVRDDREVGAVPGDPCAAERHDMLAVGNVLLRRAIVELRLEDDDGIRVADRRGQEPLGIARRRRDRNLHAGRVHVVRLGRVIVELGCAHPAAVRHPNRERELHAASSAPAVAPHVVDELVERRVAERVVLHLAHRPPPGHAQPHRSAEDACLGERRVDAAVASEPLLEACRGAKDPTQPADVLAHDHDSRVALHLDMEGVVDRLDQEALRHRQPPRADAPSPPRTLRKSASSRACDEGGATYACSKTRPGVGGRLRLGLRDASRMTSSAPSRLSSTSSSVSTPARRR